MHILVEYDSIRNIIIFHNAKGEICTIGTKTRLGHLKVEDPNNVIGPLLQGLCTTIQSEHKLKKELKEKDEHISDLKSQLFDPMADINR